MMTQSTYDIDYWTKMKRRYEFLRNWDEVDYCDFKINEATKAKTHMDVAHALDTYEKTIKNCLLEEYPPWVTEVKHCIETGVEIRGTQWMPFVHGVFDELKKRPVEISKADEVK